MYIDFEYAGHRLSEFGCIIGHVNTDTNVKKIEIGCNITFDVVKNNHSSINYMTSSKYDNVYTTTFEIIKNICDANSQDMYMTSLEVRDLVKWLNRRGYYKFKPLCIDIVDHDIYYYGSFNVDESIVSNQVIGLSLTFTSNAPYGFGEEICFNTLITTSNETVSVYGNSDEYGVIYPTIIIKCLRDGDIKLTNNTTGTYTYIKNCKKNEIITIDGEHKIIFSNLREQPVISNAFNYEYLDILVDERKSANVYSSTLPCELTISYLPIRKMGIF